MGLQIIWVSHLRVAPQDAALCPDHRKFSKVDIEIEKTICLNLKEIPFFTNHVNTYINFMSGGYKYFPMSCLENCAIIINHDWHPIIISNVSSKESYNRSSVLTSFMNYFIMQ